MKLYESREPAKPFPCPECAEYLASDVIRCRYCGVEIDREYARDAARREMLANRLYRKNHYSTHLRRGGALLSLGVAVMIASYFLFRELLRTDFVWIPRGLIVGGGADFLYGIYGLASEAQNARRELL